MPALIIVRLRPVAPMSGTDFTNALIGLTVTAYDLTLADSASGVRLGSASGLADPHLGGTNDNVDITSKQILQHYIDVGINQRKLEAVATAVIVVDPPPGHRDYPQPTSYDLRLELTRGGRDIVDRRLDYNVTITTLANPLPNNQKKYFAMPASAYATLPAPDAGLDPALAHVDLPADGQPPAFRQLCEAIDKVLSADPGAPRGSLLTRAPLTLSEARHVAAEIVWNRANVAPPVPGNAALGLDPFGALYTKPPVDPSLNADDVDRARMTFEADQSGYYGTHEAEATRLAGFVFSAAAAIACEELSRDADRAALVFPVLTGASTSTSITEATVALSATGGLSPGFGVPADYFYALGAIVPPNVAVAQRYDMARHTQPADLLSDFASSIDGGVIVAPVAPFAQPLDSPVNPDQATRRLHALGTTLGAAATITPAPPVTTVIKDWLDHPGPTDTIVSSFWIGEIAAHPDAYLQLILEVVTDTWAPLIAVVKAAPLTVSDVADLVAITDQQWRGLILGPPPPPGAAPRVGLLPPFTQPGTPAERVDAFIRHLRGFFAVPGTTGTAQTPQPTTPPSWDRPLSDVLKAFAAAYAAHAGGTLTFGSGLNSTALVRATDDVFPDDQPARDWLEATAAALDALAAMTTTGQNELQFSLMEALYARGFTSTSSVSRLSLPDFAHALTATVAYPYAAAIYAKAGGSAGPAAAPVPAPFAAVNPDGSLTDCIPPPHLSPLGLVAYLHEMLQVSPSSTCADPLRPQDPNRLDNVLALRRGRLGDVHVTRSNLTTPLPAVDLVNESLEYLSGGLSAGATGGATHDTGGDVLAGHTLATGVERADERADPFPHDPATLFGVLPQHSSPAVPVAQPNAYDLLRQDFTAPELPYPQALDVSRSYLGALGSTRFAAMRLFRKDIAEFAVDAAHEPTDFARHQWRYPVRIETAIEYLHISPEEYDLLYTHDVVTVPTPGRLLLRELFGFPAEVHDGRPWTDVVREVPEFLARTGLTYCDFIDLWRSGFVAFARRVDLPPADVAAPTIDAAFPDCAPCCPDDLVIQFGPDALVALRKLVVFIRLWRRLPAFGGRRLSFAQLRDVADVLGLFQPGDTINPDLIRQLAAAMMLRDLFGLPLHDGAEAPASATGADRTHLLALWAGPAHPKRGWAIGVLLDAMDDAADRAQLGRRGPEWTKVLAENLDPLSVLAGFDPSTPTDTWHARPTATLRFAEVLWKITLSDFTVGEIIFMFTADPHLDGDDPFALQPPNETSDDPLQLPDDGAPFGLWELRHRLLEAEPSEAVPGGARTWSWDAIIDSLRDEFGLPTGTSGVDSLIRLGERLFPAVLEREGYAVPPNARQYRVSLPVASTNAAMWNNPPGGPLRYDAATQELWTRLPLRDRDVVTKLSSVRPLSAAEQAAVRELYFAPRAALAPFALLFPNFERAVERLVHEADDERRFEQFRRAFALFHRRCELIAEHLARHVDRATGQERPGGLMVAWRLLRTLWGDENRGLTPWEDDSGAPPTTTWRPQPGAGAFAALLGLVGTGLLGELRVEGTDPAWRDLRGPLSAFGGARNHANAPQPTIVPSMSLTLTPDQQRLVAVRNGFALRDVDGEPLFGAQRFSARWRGALLVDRPGEYRFTAGAPTVDGKAPDIDLAADKRWLVTLRRGQRRWVLLNRDWPDERAPDVESEPLHLGRGVYEIDVRLDQPEPTFDRDEEVCPRHTGFQIKYAGPDSGGRMAAIPRERLYRWDVSEPLDAGITAGDAAGHYLRDRYTSSLRDIRRTYQRAFKAVLFARGFALSAQPLHGDPQSELGYLLDHAEGFAGRSYYRTGPATFATHRAFFDVNLLPVGDPFRPPAPAHDDRVSPSPQRRAALFDWWERIFDYVTIRRESHAARERPAWRLFYEASERQPDDPAELLRHFGIDIRHAPLVLTYYDRPAAYPITVGDLESEPWPMRAWQAEKWLRDLRRRFRARWIGAAQPALWAGDDPAVADAANANLVAFVRDGCFENAPPSRYHDVKTINDGLRDRARAGLIHYLSGMDRVALPFAPGTFARESRHLSDLLLQDVDAGLCERATRIEDAISAVQAFVQRARLGLEPGFVPTPAFVELWGRRFATFNEWLCCKQREVYRENWIDWDELEKARRVEAFNHLETRLREAKLTVAVPGGLDWWPGERPPPHPCLTLLQASEPAEVRILARTRTPENLDLHATRERHARPSWLAPISRQPERGTDVPTDRSPDVPDRSPDVPAVRRSDRHGELAVVSEGETASRSRIPPSIPPSELAKLPLWIQAAVRLGARFLRVAAAGVPPASKPFAPCPAGDHACCCDPCGGWHEPLVDEYYFWLADSRWFDAVVQDADLGVVPPEMVSDWHRREKLPALLDWASRPMVHLVWSRWHNGEFQPPRVSTEGLAIDPGLLAPGSAPELEFTGRTSDSLRFTVSGAVRPVGYSDQTAPGFRYDLATDAAVVLPLLVAPLSAPASFPGGLDAYPYFTYFCPGAPVEPLTVYGVAVTVAAVLRANCRFEPALKWYELVSRPLQTDNSWTRCPPDNPPVLESRPAASMAERPPRRSHSDAGRDQPCCPDGHPVDDDVARRRALLLNYLETLLQWGDSLMCRNSPEGLRQAGVIVDTMARVLGRTPQRTLAQDDADPATVSDFVPRPAPLNPRLMSLYERAADRLGLLHRCMNAQRLRSGRSHVDTLHGGDDPRRDGWFCVECGCEPCECGCDAYRFVFRVGKALELASDVRMLGAELLAAFEKGDAEHLAALRSAHERRLLELALDVRKSQWRDADWTVQALGKTKEGAQARLRYYQKLIADGLNAGEQGYLALTGVSTASRTAGNVLEAVAQGVGMTPDMWVGIAGIAGTPVQLNQLPVGVKLGSGFVTGARILNALADIASTSAGVSLTRGGWDRREAEWRHQVEVIGIEIEQIERQILGAQRRRDAALRELNNHQRQIEHSVQTQNYLRDKFTNEDLYLYLQQETAALYRQAYDLALASARRAERAFNYERGFTARRFLPEQAWDSMHEGLLAGGRLQVALRQMEKAYHDVNCREYELTKHVSLRLHAPLAFLRLQTTGDCEVELAEWMFDLDYPGHYLRRIKSVSVSIPAVVGPYTGVRCRLTLLSSTTRVDPRLSQPRGRCCGPGCPCACDDACCCCDAEPNGYALAPDDPRAVRTYAATEAIATSTGQNDAGLFELNFRDERYLPFEFAGAVSRWRVELPPQTNAFDLATLTDVVIHVNYTAREGGDTLRDAALADARCRLPGNGLRLFDARRDMPDAWNELHRATGRDRDWGRRLPLRLSESMFPFVPTRRTRLIDGVQLFFDAPGAVGSANVVVRFRPAEHCHDRGQECDCDRIDVHCVASAEWPGKFWGVVDLRGMRLGPLSPQAASDVGTFEFPREIREICAVYLVVNYCAQPWPRCGSRA